ncbi:DUF2339 domain-containing protein [Acidipila sp. EB88]|uniref:DUF2339 domain-containing protein n=1 Tax=Acidipila sp. EB88 TaxID=2305226 RepID=UPI000F5EF82B|nr:DUF2339 domain-containing protein [Acidipila sp. EB88]RRA48790.1 DUF2339 domain-containing protein [Acidipila sp. EB88]
MDPTQPDDLRAEVAALRTRVETLESQLAHLAQSPSAHSAPRPFDTAAVPPRAGTRPSDPPQRFIPPAKPSLEARIGSQVFNRVGIVAVLIGAAWFLKYAVDQQWLGPLARVLVGVCAGAGLIGWSERFRTRGYPVFSLSLKAAGTGMLYLAFWAAFALFHLVGYPMAFAGMVLITVANAWLCWGQRSEVLAAYVAIGGFLTPALLAGEHNSVAVLGCYLALLNAGLFTLIAFRNWPRLLPAAFVGTTSYLAAYALHPAQVTATSDGTAALWLVLLSFVAFSVAPLRIAARSPSTARDIAGLVLLVNILLGSWELWRFLPDTSLAARWLPMAVAAWCGLLLFSGRFLLPTSSGTNSPAAANLPIPTASESLRPLLAALVITFVALGLWSVCNAPGAIAGWTLEAATLLALSLRRVPTALNAPESGAASPTRSLVSSPVPSALLLAASALLLVGESLVGELRAMDYAVLNLRFALYLLVVAVSLFAVRAAALHHAQHRQHPDTLWPSMGALCSVLATTLLLLAGIFEIHTLYQGPAGLDAGVAGHFWDSAWAAILGVLLLVCGFRVRWSFLRWQALALLTLAIAKVFLFDTRALSQGFRILSFLGLGVLLLAVSFIYQRDLLNLRGEEHGG